MKGFRREGNSYRFWNYFNSINMVLGIDRLKELYEVMEYDVKDLHFVSTHRRPIKTTSRRNAFNVASSSKGQIRLNVNSTGTTILEIVQWKSLKWYNSCGRLQVIQLERINTIIH